MPNNQMPNYGVQMQYVSIRSTRNVSKSEKSQNNESYCIVHLKPVKCLQQRGKKEETRNKEI